MALDFGRLLLQVVHRILTPPLRWRELMQQIVYVAWESLPVVLFCVCFAAVVTIIESSFHMKLVIQNDALVPGFAAMIILRELGAVVSALLITSRVGAGIAAEVGSMQITEQVDALRMLGIDPIRFLVVPRLLGTMIGCGIVTILANLTCLYAATLVSYWQMGVTQGMFLVAMRTFVSFQDLVFSSLKGVTFGAVIPLMSCFFGLRCRSGAEGVGLATTSAVVASSVAIIVLDFVLSWVFSHFY